MAKHLWNTHGIDCNKKHRAAARNQLTSYMIPRDQLNALPLEGKGIAEKVTNCFIKWIVCMHVAFFVVQNAFFRQFLTLLSSSLIRSIPTSHTTVKKYVLEAFHRKRGEVREILHTAKSNIHISFDLWTSGNGLALLAVCAHFVDEHRTIKTVMLALRPVHGSHSGENMAEIVGQVIKDYEIEDRLGYFVLDNADSNDKCVEHLFKQLNNPRLLPEQRRLRCMGHIINLAAQAFLLGEAPPQVFEAELVIAQQSKDVEAKERELWQKKGPLGKLHNIVKFIRRTPQRRQAFAAIQSVDGFNDKRADKLGVKSDNATRWNSAYDMIHRAIFLRSRITVFCFENMAEIGTDSLSSEDWAILVDMHELLKPFKEETMLLQSRAKEGVEGAAWEVLPTITSLLQQTMRKGAERYGDMRRPEAGRESEHIFVCLWSCIKKLDKYQTLLSETPIYYAATLMNPSIKWSYCVEKRPEHLDYAKQSVQWIWDNFYKHLTIAPAQSASAIAPQPTSHRSRFGLTSAGTSNSVRDGYTVYQTQDLVPEAECAVLAEWWRDHSSDEVAKMAWDTLAIPAMSAECERVFSSAARLVTWLRNSLGDDAIEANECLKNWWDQALVS